MCSFRHHPIRCHAALVLALATACAGTGSAPVGFSGGERWVFPLVDPLEDGLLVTPVTIDGHGPYLFVIDPDANVSAVDLQVVADAGLRSGQGPQRIDETGTQQIRTYAEVVGLQVGNLSVDRRPAMVLPVGLYDTSGRHFSGVIGRDVIADSLVFGFDRDQGIAMLHALATFRPPDRSIDVRYQPVSSQLVGVEVPPVPRRLVSASINGATFAMHLDLGARASQLRESHWARAKLEPIPAKLALVDEAGTARAITQVAIARTVALSGATRDNAAFVPYEDLRWDTEGVDGALGLDFFAPFSVWVSWERSTAHIIARDEPAATVTARLARWGSAVPPCPHPGCISSEVSAAPTAGRDGAAGVTITVTRDAEARGRPLQVVLAPAPVAGKPAPGWIVANLAAGVDRLSAPFGADYADATLQVLDVSPFPRACPEGAAGCLALFAPPVGDAGPAPAPEPPGPPPLPTVIPDKLHRVTGDATIAPGDAAKQAIAAAGAPPGVAIIRVCITPDGKIASVRLIKSTRIAVYDEQIVEAIRTTWTFDPFAIDGKPAAVCAPFTFKLP